jgi:hypothetical protein
VFLNSFFDSLVLVIFFEVFVTFISLVALLTCQFERFFSIVCLPGFVWIIFGVVSFTSFYLSDVIKVIFWRCSV